MSPRRRLPALYLVSTLIALAAFACGGGGDSGKFEDVVVRESDVTPVIINSELVVGPNRFVFGILGPDGTIADAHVHLTFYDLNGDKPVRKSETDAVARVPARDAGLSEEIVHVHPDGTKHVHSSAGEDVGVYTANVTFDTPGVWGVEIDIHSASPRVQTTIRPRFDVLPTSSTPAIGSAAPRSRNATAADVADISEIDSSATPTVELHTMTIADAIAAGRPTLVLFAVPGFCESRFCGPEMEIMRKLAPKYAGRAEFIHVEFYKSPGSPDREPVDAVKEWRLHTEPWFFVIDARGMIAAKFEGPTALAELDEALRQLVGR